MIPRVVEVRAVDNYRLHVRFDDGMLTEVDLSDDFGERSSSLFEIRRCSLKRELTPTATRFPGPRGRTSIRSSCTATFPPVVQRD